MRLWHQALISKLPRQQLLGQHRECCALRGKGWQRNMRRLTMFLIIHRTACLSTMSSSCKK